MLAEAAAKAAESKAILEAQLVRAEIARQLDLEQKGRREIERMVLDEKTRVDMLTSQLDGERAARVDAETRMKQAAAERKEVAVREYEEFKQREAEVRFHIIRNARIDNVGKYQSCMVSKLRVA